MTLRKNTLQFSLLILIITILYIPQSFGQEDQEFRIGLRLYDNLQYEDALKKFENLSRREENSSNTISAFFYAKTLLQLNRNKEAILSLNKFIDAHSESRYNEEVRVVLAKAYLNQSDYIKAFRELLNLYNLSNDKYYVDYSRLTAEKIGLNYLSTEDFKKIVSEEIAEKQKSFVKLLLGKKYLKEKAFDDAKMSFIEILQLYPNSSEKDEANSLYNSTNSLKPELQQPVSSLIGVLLPLSNNKGESAANEILEGIKFAISEFNKDREDKTGLVIKDTELNPEKITVIRTELRGIENLKAIIGPVYSIEVKQALEAFKNDNIVLISPTATDDDLAAMYNNFFQANPNFTVRGKTMAQYIYYVENKRNIAILNAIEGYSPILASAFTAEFERLGGRIIIRETYKSGSFNLDVQVNKIAESRTGIEGIYIPLTDKIDASVLLSKLEEKGLDLSLYGDQDWLYAKGLESSPVLSNQLTFTSDHYLDYNNQDFIDFSGRFYKQTKKEVTRNVLYGYDTAKYLLTILRNFSGSGNAVKLKMESGLTTNGYHSNITFDNDRVNKALNIIRYRDGKFELVDEFKLN